MTVRAIRRLPIRSEGPPGESGQMLGNHEGEVKIS